VPNCTRKSLAKKWQQTKLGSLEARALIIDITNKIYKLIQNQKFAIALDIS